MAAGRAVVEVTPQPLLLHITSVSEDRGAVTRERGGEVLGLSYPWEGRERVFTVLVFFPSVPKLVIRSLCLFSI